MQRVPAKLSVYSVLIMGVALCSLMAVGGCGSTGNGTSGGGGGTNGPTPLATGGASDIFVIQSGLQGTSASILDLATSSAGNVMPKSTLIVTPELIVTSVASDSTGKIYVGGYVPSSTQVSKNYIYVYAAGATGTATALSVINVAVQPSAMAFDSAGHLYLAGIGSGQGGSVEELLPDNTAVFFDSESFVFATGLAVDGAGNVYVSVFGNTGTNLNGSIQVFAAGSQGLVTPVRTITTSGEPLGLALDHSGNLYTTVDMQTASDGAYITSSGTLMQFAGGTAPSDTPLKTISANGLGTLSGVQVDKAGNLYVLNVLMSGSANNPTEMPQVLGFAGGVTGNVEPAVTLTSSSWSYAGQQIAVY